MDRDFISFTLKAIFIVWIFVGITCLIKGELIQSAISFTVGMILAIALEEIFEFVKEGIHG